MGPTGSTAESPPGFEPVRLAEVELGRPLQGLPARPGPDGRPYRRALAFVRLHSEPLALVEVALDEEGSLSAGELAEALWPQAAERVRRHLAADGAKAPASLDVAGIPSEGEPRCLRERRAFLGEAPALTVLIPSRERPQRLQRCLDSILASEYPLDRIELIVVDNAPETDGTRRLVELYAERCAIRYLREDATGSASARNRGLREVETETVVMTDDDTVVDRHWLTEVARTFAAFPQAATVSGLLLPMELDTPPQLWFEQYGGFSRGFDRRVFDLGPNRPADEPLFPWTTGLFGTGNNFAFRTAAIREIGAFDAALGNGTPALGGVDSEILLRTILAGHTIVYEPRAVVHHAHRPDYAALRRQIHAYGAGIVACHMKTLLANPRLSLEFARKLPTGLRFALGSGSEKNAKKRADYPRELTRLELRGMLYGPVGYVRSRRKYGRQLVPAPRG
ncbi:MAG TPA: glycosyltransferase [Solirubrobacterales bacterium]|jgi:glycosyltransferase involved in cell wall biosynthesis|nr:glycosyltransferase [Solirubrobacterales bacterium]